MIPFPTHPFFVACPFFATSLACDYWAIAKYPVMMHISSSLVLP